MLAANLVTYESVTWGVLIVAVLAFGIGGGYLIYRFVWVAFVGVAAVLVVFTFVLFMAAVTIGFPPDDCSARCQDAADASGPMFDVSLFVLPPLLGALLLWTLVRWLVRGKRQNNWKPV